MECFIMQSKNTRHFSDERFKINTEEMLKDLEELINTPSVVGFYPEIHKKLAKIVGKMGYEIEYDNKRTAYVRVPGIDSSKTVCVGAHLDTIGLQVRHVMENGWIEVKNLGGINFHNVEGENVYIHTRNGKIFEGMVIGSLTLAHSRNSQMSFMYGFFFVKFLFFYCCMCCNCDIIVIKDGCFYETLL